MRSGKPHIALAALTTPHSSSWTVFQRSLANTSLYEVNTPAFRYNSFSARRIRTIATPRVSPQTTSFASSES